MNSLGICIPDGMLRVFAVAKLVILRVRSRARPKPSGLGICIPDGMLRVFAVAKLVILRVRSRARPKPSGLGIGALAKVV